MPNSWTDQWPTEPGYYWYYGTRDTRFDTSPSLGVCEVRRISNGFAYILDGHFLFECEGKGRFLSMPEPELPGVSYDN